MTTSPKNNLAILPAALLALGLSPVFITTPALAYDDDVDIVCDTVADDNDDEVFCVPVDQLKAECPIVDPQNELEICAGLNENRRTPAGVQVFSASAKKKTVSLRSLSSAFKMK